MATGVYRSNEVDVEFRVKMERSDYGVPGSPVWYEPVWETLEVLSLVLLGVDVDVESLPPALRRAVYDLAEEVEWENDDD